MLGLMLLSGLTAPADAFCGHYVGQAGAELYNNASQVGIVRQGTRTTLTLVNDYQGDLSSFALLIPVPAVLGADDVRVVEPDLIQKAELYSAPRLVTYSCDDWRGGDSGLDQADTGAEGGGPGTDGSATGVTVEAEFSAGEYDIVILNASESNGLLTWLDGNGYAVDATAEALLQTYIDQGAYFFAAKVDLEELPADASYLSPLQFGYPSDAFMLPVRLGTASANGTQDLIVYALSDNGQVHVSNYPQVEIESDCMVDTEAVEGGLGGFYVEMLDASLEGQDRAGWTLEYGWSPAGCDPCSGDPLTQEDLEGLGWQGDANDAYFSRLHMRYTPDQIDQDLVLYASGLGGTHQQRYIEYDYELEDRFPNCITGFADDPGSCGDAEPTDTGPADDLDPDPADPVVEPEARFGCAVPGPVGGLLLALMGLGLVRRRRS